MMPLTSTQVHLANAFICFGIGVPANAALLWLIRYRTPDTLRPFSRILGQSALLDVLTLCIYPLVQPLFVNREDVAITGAVGVALVEPSTVAARGWNFAFVEVFLFMTNWQYGAQPLLFYYRYRVMCT